MQPINKNSDNRIHNGQQLVNCKFFPQIVPHKNYPTRTIQKVFDCMISYLSILQRKT